MSMAVGRIYLVRANSATWLPTSTPQILLLVRGRSRSNSKNKWIPFPTSVTKQLGGETNSVKRMDFLLKRPRMFEIMFANWGPPCRILVENISEWFSLFFLLYRSGLSEIAMALGRLWLSIWSARSELLMVEPPFWLVPRMQ